MALNQNVSTPTVESDKERKGKIQRFMKAVRKSDRMTPHGIHWITKFKGKPSPYSCQHRCMLEDNGVKVHETSVVGNSTEKIYNKHAKVLQPPPMSSCSMLVSSAIFRGGQQDGGCSHDSGGPTTA
ncbi:uncharacterized protein V6R79_006642 [Siganus canaliculatus]